MRRTLLALALVLPACNAEHGEHAEPGEAPRVGGAALPADAVDVTAAAQDRPSVVVAGYDLGRPLRAFLLPDELREVSAITALGGQSIACLQDELGVLYELELATGRFTRATPFGPPGDYEGLASDGDTRWVLRSDGLVTELLRDGADLVPTRTFTVGAAHDDYEGLAFDPGQARLVVAPKSPPEAAPGEKGKSDLRPLFTVDLRAAATGAAPLLVLDREALLSEARDLGVTVPTKTRRNGEAEADLRVRLSEVAVHPGTGELWLCSAADNALLVVTRAGRLVGLHFFAKDELPQLEAATFLPTGELVLASEGVDGPAPLRVFGRAR